MPFFIAPSEAAGPNYPYFELEDNDECRFKLLSWYSDAQEYHERD